MTLLMCCSFLLCWTPYAVVAMIRSYAEHIEVGPVVAVVPGLAAKTSHALDPVIYCAMNKNFSRLIYRTLKVWRPPSGETSTNSGLLPLTLKRLVQSVPVHVRTNGRGGTVTEAQTDDVIAVNNTSIPLSSVDEGECDLC